MPIFLRIVRVVTLVAAFSFVGIIGLVFWQAQTVGGKGIEPLLPLIALLSALAIVPLIIGGIRLIRNERIVYYGVSIILLAVIYAGFLALNGNYVGFHIATTLGIVLSFYFMFQNISLWILGLFIGLFFVVVCFQGIPLIVLLTHSHESAISQNSNHINPSNVTVFFSYLMLSIGCLFIALAYIPRGIDWKRYFFPYRNRPFVTFDRRDRGFTLIEMLIAIAIIGIVSGGILHSWSTVLRTQNELQIRTHAAEILHSEMNALMSNAQIPAPSDRACELPIRIEEFVTPYRFSGTFLVEESGEAGIVKITARLTQKLDESNERHFRLVGYRRWETDKKP